MSFSRSKIKLDNVYHFFGDHIKGIIYVCGLGVIFQTTLLFSSHIEYICMKALRCLGFIIRNTKDFKNELWLKTLHTSLVIPILEYCSIIWNPYQKSLSEAIERVQRRFVRLIAYKRNTFSNISPTILLPLT